MIVDEIPPRLRSKIVAPAGDEYERLRHSYAYRGSPELIILCESAADVSSGLALARTTGVPLSVRSGGHGVGSSSTNDGGIILDLARMNRVEVLDPSAGLVRIGPGARWGAVASALDAYGLAIGSGDYGDVGVGGLVLSGGIGLLGRAHGLTIDALRTVAIVTADGLQRHASATENPELFWAIRGGGGQFGVVISCDFVAHRVRDVVHARIRYDASDAASLVEDWARAVEDAPRELTSFLYLTEDSAEATVVYAGADGHVARTALRAFDELGSVLDATTTAGTYASLVPLLGEPHRGDAPPDVRCGLLTHVTVASAQAIAELLAPETALTVQLRAVGGAINDVPPDATAYSHRHQNFCVVAIGLEQNGSRLSAAWDRLLPHLDGAYPAFETRRGRDQTLAAYPDATLKRLAAVKAKFDPNHLFEPNFVWG